MRGVVAAFLPNRVVSGRTIAFLSLLQAATFVMWWTIYPPSVVPRPAEAVTAFFKLVADGGFLDDALSSVVLSVEAILLSTLISVPLAYATVLPAMRLPVTVVTKLRFLGLTGVTFLFGLALTGHALKLGILVFGISVYYLTSVIEVVSQVPKERFDYARTLRMGEWHVVWEVVVRGTRSDVLRVMRQNGAMALMMLTMVEGLVRSEGGLGVLLLNQNRGFNLPAVFAVQLVVMGIGLLQDYLLGLAHDLLCPYAKLRLERK